MEVMKTYPTSWRLTAEDKAILAQLGQQYGLTQIDVLRHLMRLATRDGIHLGRRTQMETVKILLWIDGSVLYEGEGSLCDVLVRANLDGANLDGANLVGARLVRARLDTGELWEEYLAQTVPALLIAGGQPLEACSDHWGCHSWDNCPMAWAFQVGRIEDVPLLYRPRARQFVQLFDATLIPCPVEEAI